MANRHSVMPVRQAKRAADTDGDARPELKFPRFTDSIRLGEGTFSTVYSVATTAGERVAVKVFKKEHYNAEDIRCEATMMKAACAASAEHFVPFLKGIRNGGRLCIVTGLCKMTLKQHIQETSPADVAATWPGDFKQLMDALCVLRGLNIVHRDIKPDNILIDAKNTWRLSDFGSASPITGTGESLSTYVTTRHYRAPELLAAQTATHNETGSYSEYGYSVDVFSAAVVLYEAAVGTPIFCGTSSADQLSGTRKVLKASDAQVVTTETLQGLFRQPLSGAEYSPWLDVLKSMLSLDPHRRTTAIDASHALESLL